MVSKTIKDTDHGYMHFFFSFVEISDEIVGWYHSINLLTYSSSPLGSLEVLHDH